MATIESEVASAYRDAALPGLRTPWREVTFSVIDLETTGLDPASDEIISFAAVTVEGGRVRLDDARYELIRPTRMPDADTIRIHGLRDADLVDAPPLSERLDVLLAALTGRAVVAHVAAVERGFLGAALSSVGLKFDNPIVDTAVLDRELRRLRRDPPDRDPDRLVRHGARARPARAPAPPCGRRCPDHGAGVHRLGHPPRRLRGADARVARAALPSREAALVSGAARPFRQRPQSETNRPTSSISGNSA